MDHRVSVRDFMFGMEVPKIPWGWVGKKGGVDIWNGIRVEMWVVIM